jgi:hypothetical protein
VAEHFQVDNAYFTQHARHLPSDAFLVYSYLCFRADAQGVCWPSILGIATELERSRTTVKRNLDILLDYGLVRMVASRRGGSREDFQVLAARDVAAGWTGKDCTRSGQNCTHRVHSAKPKTARNTVTTARDTCNDARDTVTPAEDQTAHIAVTDCTGYVHKQDPRTRPSTESEYLRFASDIHGAVADFAEEPLFPEPDDPLPPAPAPTPAPRPTAPKPAEPPAPAESAPAKKRNSAPPRASTPEKAAKQATCAAFLAGYEALHGHKPCFTKADSGILCNALSAVKTAMECDWPAAAEEMGRVLEAFFAADWITERGSSLDLLPKRLNELRNAKGATNGQSRERDGRHAGAGHQRRAGGGNAGGADSAARDHLRILEVASFLSPNDPALVRARQWEQQQQQHRGAALA